MIRASSHESGFSAVELLVTLFIAAAFLIAGHQLYTAIIRDSGAARQKARASVVAYDWLRRYSASVPANCSAGGTSLPNNQPVTPAPENLKNVTVTVTYECAQPGMSELVRVRAVVKYGTEGGEVTHAIYAKQ